MRTRAWILSLLGALWLAVMAPALGMAQGAGISADPVAPVQSAPALLVADRVFVTPDRTLIAEGNVEAFQGDIRLRASRITFDRTSGQLTIEGPIRIDQGGTITVLAESAQLDKGLENGILLGARLVLDQQLQLAGLQMTRVGGRYTQLYKTAVTSCRVCGNDEPPLWQIRARKVIHDQQERQLYFEDAQFLVLDVPVFYLPAMRLPDLDRLQSEIAVKRVKRDTLFRVGVIHYKSLRDSEDDALIPSLVADAHFQQRVFPRGIGGELRLGLNLHGHNRTSSLDVLGRDIDSATADIDWRRSWILAGGLRADWQMGLAVDAFDIKDDSNFAPQVTRATPRMGLALRLPMTRRTASGATHFLEPVLQLGWSDVNGANVPNDQSGFVDFDQGNLMSLSRFPTDDRREDGFTFVYGLNWARYAPSGWQASATIGQVFREAADPDFTTTSGLSGTSSDILLAGQVKLDKGLSLTARGLVNDSFGLSKAELRGDWDYKRIDLSSSYLWLGRDAAEGRTDAVSEVWFDGSYEVNPRWSASANLRYDISDARATTAGIGLVYRHECITLDISLNRRYTSSTSVEPSTDFGFTIALNGFAVESRSNNYRRTCDSKS